MKESMLAECAYHALSRQKFPLKFVTDTSARYLTRLNVVNAVKCLPFTSTYFTFYAADDPLKPKDETAGVNCEKEWKPLYRPVRTFVLDVFPFAAKGTGEPTISTMCNEVDYNSLTDERDREAWEICCQLQVCNVAFVTTLGLQLAFTEDYPKEARVRAVIHAVRANRLIRNREKLRTVKHMHVSKRLIMDRCVSLDWFRNPHLPQSIRDRLSDPLAICLDKPKSKGRAVSVTPDEAGAAREAVEDLSKSHTEVFEDCQKVFSHFDWKPRTKGDTLKGVTTSTDDEIPSTRKRKRVAKGERNKRGDWQMQSDEDEENELSDYDSETAAAAQTEDRTADDVEDELPKWVLKSLERQSKRVVHSRIINPDDIVAEWEREDEAILGAAMAAEDAKAPAIYSSAGGRGAPSSEIAEIAKTLNRLVDF
ncbi:hypothetical protein HDU96_004666 [Phlyctochytrium bullatum]|nr:hypothetical protein HDU96_004666 [Phlyctochytrium bullatum]